MSKKKPPEPEIEVLIEHFLCAPYTSFQDIADCVVDYYEGYELMQIEKYECNALVSFKKIPDV